MTSKAFAAWTRARVEVQLLDVAARHGVLAGWIALFVATFVFLSFAGGTAAIRLDVWYAALALSALLGIGVCVAWRHRAAKLRGRSEQRRLARTRRYNIANAIVAGLQGTVWASLAVLVGETDDAAVASVVFLLGAALVMSVGANAGNRVAQMLFIGPIVVVQEFVLLRNALGGGMLPQLLPLGWMVLAACVVVGQRRAATALATRLATRIDDERRAHEQATLLENAPFGILVVRHTQIVACNEALLRMFGYPTKDDLVGQELLVLLLDDEALLAVRAHAVEASHGASAARIVQRRRYDGTTIDVMLKLAVVAADEPEREFIAIYEDLNERMRIEGEYQHLVRMQRLVFEAAGEGIAIVNDGVIEQGNQALADLVGLKIAELSGKPLKDIFEDPENWSKIAGHFDRLGNKLKLERRVLRPDGRALWVAVTGCLVEAPDGGVAPHGARSIWILADLSVQKQKEAENWHHANHDIMTGLPNRRFLQDRLDQALASARRDSRKVGIVMLDLDGFKTINDTRGHHCGDRVLQEVARRLSLAVRELDTVGRWGGDEFVLVLREIESSAIVEDTVERVLARLAAPIDFEGHRLVVGASIGIALYPDHGDEVEVLMLAADLAMYESKGARGNTWRFANALVKPPRGKYRPGDLSAASLLN